jgi:glycosyltransferase involved in cell wall biosynthesis
MILLILTQKVDRDDAILGFFVEWLDRLAARVDRLQVIALESGDPGLPENVEVISLGRERGAGHFSMLFRFHRKLFRLCRKARPDVMLVHMVPRYVLYALPLASVFRIPIDLWYTHKGVDKYLRMAHPFVRHAFTASEESFRLPSRKKVVTGHGINTRTFSPHRSGEARGIVTVGRITPSKDQEVLVRALALLKERRGSEGLETRIVGEPLLEGDRRYLERVRAQVSQNALDGLVRFDGAVPHHRMPEVYGTARVLVNASHTGSVDKVVLEAMATGTLPLTCNESFVPLLGAWADRLVFEKGDPVHLAAKLEGLLDLGEEERAGLAGKLREIVIRDHDLEDLMDRIVARMGGKQDEGEDR